MHTIVHYLLYIPIITQTSI